jgi:glycosyltransferase involved in cell wall biosynthesis
MNVGVDATGLANRHGDGRFARNAIRRLVELDPDTRYVLHVDPATARTVELPAGAEVKPLRLSRDAAGALAADATRPLADLLRASLAAGRGRYDAFLFPSLVTWVPAVGVPAVVGIHDANVVRFGADVLPARRARLAWRAKQALAVRTAARLFTVSRAARQDLVTHLRIPAERLSVVPEAPDPVFAPRAAADARPRVAALGLDPGDGFVLLAGGIGRHKSPGTLLEALAALRTDGRAPPPVLAVDALENRTARAAAAALRERAAALGLGDRLLLPGFVDDATLACLYSLATAVVSTSLGEGFGLPPVEAAACGAPVVVSDIPAHRESLGEAALRFAPGDARGLAGALARLLDDPALRDRLGERARARASEHSWDRAATELRRLLGEAAATRARGRGAAPAGRPPSRRPGRRR